MSKRIPIEERRISTTFSLSLKTLEKLDEIQERHCPEKSRSYTIAEVINVIYDAWFSDQERTEEFPDDVSEIGYNPYTGCYEEDL